MKRWLWSLLLVFVVLLCGAAVTFYLAPIAVSDAAVRFHLWRSGVHSRYVNVDGNRIHFFDAPARSAQPGKPLLLVHGLGARGEDWAPMISALAAQGFHVYALDLLGYGRSARPDVVYSIALEEKIVVDFMRAVGLNRADVAGWSMGGWVALKLAADHPMLVDRLVVYDTAGIYFPPTFADSLFTPHDAAGLEQLQVMLSPHPVALPGFVQRAVIRRLRSNAWVIQRSLSAMKNGRDLLDFQLHNISRPTLIVWGANDTLIPSSVGETMHREIPGSNLLLVEGCGHMAPSECARPVVDGTVRFLQAEPPIVGGQETVAGN
jgi:pimeloyl-ACP methyl ester carboxylesterase